VQDHGAERDSVAGNNSLHEFELEPMHHMRNTLLLGLDLLETDVAIWLRVQVMNMLPLMLDRLEIGVAMLLKTSGSSTRKKAEMFGACFASKP
jgi:hypothetical protein